MKNEVGDIKVFSHESREQRLLAADCTRVEEKFDGAFGTACRSTVDSGDVFRNLLVWVSANLKHQAC